MILPTLALSITSFAGLQRITRGELLDVLRQITSKLLVPKDFQKTVWFMFMPSAMLLTLITLLGFELAAY